MNKSLQDQLINSGLIDRKKARKITADQQKNRRKLRGSVASQNIQTLDNEAANANAQRDRELNRQRQEQSERKAIAAQIRQIVHANRLPREQEGDATFNFVVRGKVKRINLSEETRKRISTGGLAIVEVDSRYDLVPSGVAEKLWERDAACVVFYNDPNKRATPVEDGYADFQVPDDLVW